MDTWQKYAAELLGTFVLVFGGTTAIVAVTGSGLNLIVIPFAFGLALLAGLYAFGEVSGGHYNPAVSLAMFLDGRLSSANLIRYWAAQFAGGIVAALVLAIATSRLAVKTTATVPGVNGQWDSLPHGVHLHGHLRPGHPAGQRQRPVRRERASGHPADARRGAPGGHPVQRCVGEPGADLRARSGRQCLDRDLDLSDRAAARSRRRGRRSTSMCAEGSRRSPRRPSRRSCRNRDRAGGRSGRAAPLHASRRSGRASAPHPPARGRTMSPSPVEPLPPPILEPTAGLSAVRSLSVSAAGAASVVVVSVSSVAAGVWEVASAASTSRGPSAARGMYLRTNRTRPTAPGRGQVDAFGIPVGEPAWMALLMLVPVGDVELRPPLPGAVDDRVDA